MKSLEQRIHELEEQVALLLRSHDSNGPLVAERLLRIEQFVGLDNEEEEPEPAPVVYPVGSKVIYDDREWEVFVISPATGRMSLLIEHTEADETETVNNVEAHEVKLPDVDNHPRSPMTRGRFVIKRTGTPGFPGGVSFMSKEGQGHWERFADWARVFDYKQHAGRAAAHLRKKNPKLKLEVIEL